MPALRDLADEYDAYRQSTDLHRLVYWGSTDHLERWEDVSADAIAARQVALRDFADRADSVGQDAGDAGTLRPLDRALLANVAFTARATAHQLDWEVDQTMVNPAFGVHQMMLTFLGRFSLVTAEHGRAYVEKLRAVPDLLTGIVAGCERASDQGRIALASHLRGTAAGVERYLAGDRSSDPLCSQASPTDLTDAEAERWRAEVRDAVDDAVRPALAAYATSLCALAQRGRDDDLAGLCHLPGGDEVYGNLAWSNTSTDTSPEEIHRIGLEQVALLEDEYRSLAGPSLGTTDVAEIYRRLRDDESMKYRSPADVVRDATEALGRATAEAPRWFSHLPESTCSATAIEQGPLAYYSPPDLETGKPARFFFNTSDPSAWSTYQLEAVTYHESIPGHHLHLALQAEDPRLHPVQRRLLVTAHSEGWGLYTERLADEMGLYSNDLARVGMLSADSMRACRLVVDTGMHALGWTRDQAIEFMVDHSPMSRAQVVGEIDRYIGMPGQALSYMIGRLEIDRIRRDAQAGPGLDLPEFHDRVLRHGTVPLGTLRELVLGPEVPDAGHVASAR